MFRRRNAADASAYGAPWTAGLLTAKMTAILSGAGSHQRMSADPSCWVLIGRGRLRTLADGRNAVFKTVCGALLRRPGWVRFPSIPAKLGPDDSQEEVRHLNVKG